MMIVCLLLAAGMIACTPAPRADEATFQSENPAAKLYAIQQAGDAKRTQDIPDLIAALDSDDPAVRLFAIKALEEITGKRYGYRPYDSPHLRRQAVDRWAAAYKAGELAADQSDPPQPTDEPHNQPS